MRWIGTFCVGWWRTRWLMEATTPLQIRTSGRWIRSHTKRRTMRVGRCLHEIEHHIHVSWGREPHRNPIRARIAEVDSRISLQHLAAFSNNRPGQPDLDEIYVFKMGDLLAVHPIGEVVLEHGRALDHPIDCGDLVSLRVSMVDTSLSADGMGRPTETDQPFPSESAHELRWTRDWN